jgi:short-subunit dehydrogenase
MDCRGKVALVTGGSSGIGRAVATSLSGAGAEVVVHGRDAERTTRVAHSIGGDVALGDLGSAAGVDSVVSQVRSQHDRVDILVASAGLGWSGPFQSMPVEEIERLVAVDLAAPLLLARAVLPGMVSRDTGHIVLVGSVAGRTGVAGEAVYAATKAGVDLFAESLRMELVETGVMVTVIVPAAVATEFFVRRGREYDRRVPRPMSPEAVATAVLSAVGDGRADVWLPGWIRIAPTVRSLLPGPYRRLSARFGEPVRSAREEQRDQW